MPSGGRRAAGGTGTRRSRPPPPSLILHGLVAFDLESFLGELQAFVEEAEWPVETLRYGAHPEQVADLRFPERPGPHPLAVVVHGGFWRAVFTRATTAALAVDLARRGWASLNVEYRRVGCDGGVPETLDDVAAAVEAGLGHVGASRTLVLGHSAGGHLALWAGSAARVDAAVSLAGVADLAAAAHDGLGEGAALEFAGGTPAERPDTYALADPMRRLPPRVPTLLVHGDADDRVPVEQSRHYAAAAGEGCTLLELPGTGHFEPIDPRSNAWAATVGRLDSLL
jgi:acetyl esterase/lipase